MKNERRKEIRNIKRDNKRKNGILKEEGMKEYADK